MLLSLSLRWPVADGVLGVLTTVFVAIIIVIAVASVKDCKGVKRCKRCRATAMRATPTRRDEQDGGEKEGEGDGNDEPGREHDGDVEGKNEVVKRTARFILCFYDQIKYRFDI